MSGIRALLWLALLGLSACGGGGIEPGPPTPPGDTGGPAPIVAPANTWTFIPIEGARCANGSPTGIGVRLVPGSRELFIYLDGGGSCSSGDSCWGDGPGGAANLDGYGAAEFAREQALTAFTYLDGSPGTRNPFAGMNSVMVPYCTGDIHGGTRLRQLAVGTQVRDTYFVGADNLRLALDRLAATFPTLDAVWLMGTSAGGGGANLNYSRVRSTLRSTVHLVVDSAAGFEDDADAQRAELWGIQSPCAGCMTAADIRSFNRSLDPASRYAFLSFRFDAVGTVPGWTLARHDQEFSALVTGIQAGVNARTFVADNSATGFGPPTLHVVTTKNVTAIREAHLAFMEAMVRGTGWENRVFVVP